MNSNQAHLLLLHQLRIRAVIHHTGTKHWSRKGTVDFLGIDILQLPIQDEFVALQTQADCQFPAQQNKSKDIPVLKCCFSLPS